MTQQLRELFDDATPRALLSAAAHTATFQSETLTIGDADRWGILFDVGTVSGTNPTLDIKVQTSFDGGTTWLDTYPGAVNSETQAGLAQITASIETSEMWDRAFGPYREFQTLEGGGAAIKPVVRLVGTIGGTDTPTFTITKSYFFTINYPAR